jgi:hypothetical protein
MPSRMSTEQRQFHLDYGRNALAQMCEDAIARVEIATSGDDNVCEECAALNGQRFDINHAPLLPIHQEKTATDEDGEKYELPICRCIYLAAID